MSNEKYGLFVTKRDSLVAMPMTNMVNEGGKWTDGRQTYRLVSEHESGHEARLARARAEQVRKHEGG